jgi:large subunit ribosomal protein L1
MSKLTKNQKKIQSIYNKRDKYILHEASKIIKQISVVNFNASIELSIRLNVDPRKSDQMIRGTVMLPNGTGKKNIILALLDTDQHDKVKSTCNPDYLGLDDYINKIKNGWLEFDVIVTTPSIMLKLGSLGKILGPRGLMPNPKNGTVTLNPCQAINDIRLGKIEFKVDRYGIIHACIGKTSFTNAEIEQNATEFMNIIYKLKPSSVKGEYVKSIYMSSTMSPSINILYSKNR